MNSKIRAIRSFLNEDEGATATEYAVMLALVIAICIGAISALGTKVSGSFANLDSQLP